MSFFYPPKVFLLFIFAEDLSSVVPAFKIIILADIVSATFILKRQNDAK